MVERLPVGLQRWWRKMAGRPAVLAPPPTSPALRFPIAVMPHAARRPAVTEDWLYSPSADAQYEAMLAAETQFWRDGDPFNEMVARQPWSQRTYFRFVNEAFSGDPRVPWWIWVGRQGPFARAASIGSGGGPVETTLLQQGVKQMVLYDLNAVAGASSSDRMPAEVRQRCRWERVDLNFGELPANEYDLIVNNSCLHHIVNLEHVLYQIRRALRPGGLFAVFDFIGPSRFQYSQQHREIAEAVRLSVPQRFRQSHIDCLGVPPLGEEWGFSPFEAVRSDEIVPLVHHFFEPNRWVGLGGLWVLLGFSLRPAIFRRRALMQWLLRLDLELTRSGTLPAIYGFGLFRPRP